MPSRIVNLLVEPEFDGMRLDTFLAAAPGMPSRSACARLVEDGAEVVVGCVGVRALSEDVCELKTLFVYERLQGQGWGRRLAEQAIGLARSRGFRAMRLDTISTSANAIGLYRRLGFRDFDRYDDNPQADVFMELDLAR